MRRLIPAFLILALIACKKEYTRSAAMTDERVASLRRS